MKKSWWLALLLVLPYAWAKPAGEVLKDVWDAVITVGSLSWLGIPGDIVLIAVVRILIFILIFAVFFAVLTGLGGKMFSFLSRKHAAIVALVLAIISSIFIPPSVILAIGGGFGVMVSLFLIGLPIVGLALLLTSLPNDKCFWNLLKLLITALLYWILTAINYHITQVLNVGISQEVIDTVGIAADWAIGFTVALMIYYILKMLGCLFGKAGQAVGISFSGIVDRLRQGPSGPGTGGGTDGPQPPPPGDPRRGILQGIIVDAVSGEPLESTITITNGGRTVKRFNGRYEFPKLKPGVYSLVSKPINDAYNTITKGNITLAAGQTLREDFRHNLNHQGDATELNGRIYDSGNNNHPLASHITIAQNGQVLVNNLFPNGVYRFERMTPGTYDITSTPDDRNYPPIHDVVIIREGQNEHDFPHKNAVSDSGVKGTIKGNNREIISQITLSQGTNVIITRSRKGEYHYPNLAPGNYIIESKPGRGFNTITQDVTLLPGRETEVNFEHSKQEIPPSGDGSGAGSGKKNYKFFTGIVANIKIVIKNIDEFNLKEAKKVWTDCKRSTTRARGVCEKLFNDLEKDHPGHRPMMDEVIRRVDAVRKEMNKIRFTDDLDQDVILALEKSITEIAEKLTLIEGNVHEVIHATLKNKT